MEKERAIERRVERSHPSERADEEHGQGKKWPPAAKYAAVMVAAGMGGFLIFNAFSPVFAPGVCDEADSAEGPCIESPVVGGVIGGLSLFIIAVGIAVEF